MLFVLALSAYAGGLTLSASHLFTPGAGGHVLAAVGASPGDTVYFAWGKGAEPAGTCVGAPLDACLDLRDARRLGRAVVDADGVARLEIPIPARATSGHLMAIQAIRSEGPLRSNVVERVLDTPTCGPDALDVPLPRVDEVITASGDVPIMVTATDPCAREIGLTVELTLDGWLWREATVVDPAVPGDGTPTAVAWDVAADAGIHHPLAPALRVTPWVGEQVGAAREVPLHDDLVGTIAGHAAIARQARLDALRWHALYYDEVDEDALPALHAHELVVIKASAALDRPWVARVQAGADPQSLDDDVLVLLYLSIGEDERTHGMSSGDMLADPRFRGDGTDAGTGPRMDPRADPAVDPIADAMDTPEGVLSFHVDPDAPEDPDGRVFAPYYLDDNDREVFAPDDDSDIGPGKPDRNVEWGSCFVNAGHPLWYAAARDMRVDDHLDNPVAGIDEILTLGAGRGYGADGLFLDTLDVAAPNAWTDEDSFVQTEFEWTAPGVRGFVDRLRAEHAHAVLMQNRGVFFFNPDLPHFAWRTTVPIDLLLFESFRLDSSDDADWTDAVFRDNAYVQAPRVGAEAARSGGFRVLSLGYAEGPSWGLDRVERHTGDTGIDVDAPAREDLAGCADPAEGDGCAELHADVAEALWWGMRHYLTEATLVVLNTFVRDHGPDEDTDPPRWSSTWNPSPGWPPDAPPARAGIQRGGLVVSDDGTLRAWLEWDVALDASGVDFEVEVDEVWFPVEPEVGEGYERGTGPDVFPYTTEVPVGALEPHELQVHAVDGVGNRTDLEPMLVAAPPEVVVDGELSEWEGRPSRVDPDEGHADVDFAEVWTAITPGWVAGALTAYGSLDGLWFVLIDTDGDPTTGNPTYGTELLLQAGGDYLPVLYTMPEVDPDSGVAPWIGDVADVPFVVAIADGRAEWSVATSALTPGTVRVLLVRDGDLDLAPDDGSAAVPERYGG